MLLQNRAFLALVFVVAELVASLQPQSSSLRINSSIVPVVSVPSIDADAEAAAAAAAANERSAAHPHRFAVPFTTKSYDTLQNGVWEENDEGWSIWRLRIDAPGALHINLGFSEYHMPMGGSLHLTGATTTTTTTTTTAFVFTEADNKPHGELWTPTVFGSTLEIEVNLPPGTSQSELSLTLASINSGFRGFFPSSSSGSCNVDVACPEADGWRDEVSSVGVYGQGGTFFCTGTLINNALNDRTPYFLTAFHCGIDTNSRAQSVVVYWNFETSSCGGDRDGSLFQYQSGSSLIASYLHTDFTLLLLDDQPDEEWGIHYAGWDRSGSPLSSAVTIHHPNADEKSISIENDTPYFVSHLFSFVEMDMGPSIYIGGWDKGTTEYGSSGGALFDGDSHRIVGILAGGASACGKDLPDWYGSIVGSWEGGDSSTSRLRDWLDPLDSNVLTVNTIGSSVASEDGPTTPTPAPVPIQECFSGANTVEVQGSGLVNMSDLRIGDRVRTCTGEFSSVYSFFHRHEDHVTKYMRITTTNNNNNNNGSSSNHPPLEVTFYHIVYTDDGQVVRAGDLKVGDIVQGAKILAIDEVSRQGLYAPVTQSGTLIVSGVCASSYVALWNHDRIWLQNWIIHSAMSAFRMVCGDRCSRETYDTESGFATQYIHLLRLILWTQFIGGKLAVYMVVIAGAPILILLRMIEVLTASTLSVFAIVVILSPVLWIRSGTVSCGSTKNCCKARNMG